MVEKLTQDLIQRAQSHIDEIEELGGMAKAIEAGDLKQGSKNLLLVCRLELIQDNR